MGDPNAGNYDVMIAKFNNAGIMQWAHTFGTSVNDFGLAIAVDATGNIFVSGKTDGTFPDQTSAGNTDVFAAKYDATGVKQWIIQFGNSGIDTGNDIAVDSTGNAYVVGAISGSLPGQTTFPAGGNYVVKLNKTDGAIVWGSQFYGTEAYAVAISGNAAFITGTTRRSLDDSAYAGGQDLFITKYDLVGNKTWLKMIGSSADDFPAAITVQGGSLYVTGYTKGSIDGHPLNSTNDLFIVKYATSDGSYEWSQTTESTTPQEGTSIVATDAGVFVCGTIRRTGSSGTNILVRAYETSGTMRWEQQVDGVGSNVIGARGITATSSALFVTGSIDATLDNQAFNGGTWDAVLLQYDLNGCRL